MKGKTIKATIALITLALLGIFLPLSTSLGQLSELPGVPIESGSSQQPSSQNTGREPGYGGYGNGSAAQVNLPADSGTADVGLSSSEINSGGGIVNDWPGTPQDESKATAVGVVETAGVHNLAGNDDLDLSVGSAGSSYPPETGIIGSIEDVSVPGAGQIFAGAYRTVSTKDFTENELTVLLVKIDALNLAIPLVQSSSEAKRDGSKVSSDGSSDVIASNSGKPLIIGKGLVNGSDALSIMLLNASSHSEANGAKAGNNNSWNLVNVSAAGIPVVAINDQTGAMLAGATLIPAGDKYLLVVEPVPGIIGIYVGETWSNTDGKSFAYGGANVLRISLLGNDNFLILGHAGSGANKAYADGPGAGRNQENEGYGNLSPKLVDPPNDVPMGFKRDENPIGNKPPGDKPPKTDLTNDWPELYPDKPAEDPSLTGELSGDASGDSSRYLTRSVLPLTGAQSVVLLLVVFASLSSVMAMKMMRQGKTGVVILPLAADTIKVAPVRELSHDAVKVTDLQPVNSPSAEVLPAGDGPSQSNIVRQQGVGHNRSHHIYAPVRVKHRRRFF